MALNFLSTLIIKQTLFYRSNFFCYEQNSFFECKCDYSKIICFKQKKEIRANHFFWAKKRFTQKKFLRAKYFGAMNTKYIFFKNFGLQNAHRFPLSFSKNDSIKHTFIPKKKKISYKFKTNLKIKTALEQFWWKCNIFGTLQKIIANNKKDMRVFLWQ